jgi:hypothetical protein
MEQESGQDPEHDGPAGSQPPPDSSHPGDTGVPGSGASGAGSSGADADADVGDADGEESVFGPWDALEGTLGAAKEREELLAGFARGGVWDKHPPGPELAVALARAAGPDWRCAVATGEEMIGLLRGMAALQSWAGAGLLGMIRALIRDDDEAFLGRPRHGDLPDEWDESLVHEIALALAVSAPSAGKTARAAWELGARLPGIELLLRDGTLDLPRARLVAEVFEDLSDENARKAEELLIPRLTEPPRKTYTQIGRIATAIAAEVDPGLAERRREAAERHRSRVVMFREGSGAAALCGRDLPTDQTLAAFAHVNARAQVYKESGVFPEDGMDRLRATAYLDILNDIAAEDRIAYGRLIPESAPGGGDAPDAEAAPDGHGDGDDEYGPQDAAVGGSDCPCEECDGRCAPPDDNSDFPDEESGDEESGDDEPGDDEPGDDDLGGPGSGSPRGGSEPPSARVPGDDAGPGAGDSGAPPPAPRSPSPQPSDGSPPTLTDLVFPLATLLGLAERPGEGHGLGTLDPALCRALAATAAVSPHSTVCVTVTDPDGIAIGHGCAASGRPARPPGGPPPPLVALPARINLTITAGRLAELRAGPDAGPPGPPGQRETGWAFAPGGVGPPGDPDWCGPWALTLPSGQECAVPIEPVPTYDCDHRNESHAYKPNATLRHLVQIRDYTCTFPPCSRHARDSDFEHAVPYDQGGRTCACNAGARSRKCHRIKQSSGWNLTQPKPGWHQWTTPRGRTYTQGPKRYAV